MAAAPGTTRELLNSTFSERLEELRGVDQKKVKRGKKLKIAPGKSYTEKDSEEEVENSEEDAEEENSEEEEEEEFDDEDLLAEELLGGGDVASSRRSVSGGGSEGSSSKSASREEKSSERSASQGGESSRRTRRVYKETSDEEEEEEEMDDVMATKPSAPLYAVGSYVAAVYDQDWYVAQVEAEEPENECPGFTLLKYMERKGHNQFVWGNGKDTLKTINSDVLMVIDPPIPVSSRLWGLPKEVVKEIEKLKRVKWFFIVKCPLTVNGLHFCSLQSVTTVLSCPSLVSFFVFPSVCLFI
jgi:hypothetical protein